MSARKTLIVLLIQAIFGWVILNATLAGDNTTDVVFLTGTQLAEKIQSGEITSQEVVEAFLEQISEHNDTLNAIVTLDKEGALERAKEADEALANDEVWGPLHGVPVTIKDQFATKGLRTTSSYPPLSDYIPEEDATLVARLRDAGAIILGKTNMPYLAGDFQTRSPIFGVSNNPWDINRTPGGSTGGGAAAVAAGLSPLEIGSDVGSSIRLPSHFCGIFGLKPTEHLVSDYGSFPGVPGAEAYRNMWCYGPLARSIDDLRLCLQIIAGPDNHDIKVPPISLVEPKERELKELRIAWTDDFDGVPVSSETREVLQTLVNKLSEMGCTVERLNPPDFDFQSAWHTWGAIIGKQTGLSIPPLLFSLLQLTKDLFFKDTPMLEMSFEPMTVKKYMEALTRRDSLISSLDNFLTEWDVWLCPVSSTPAFQHLSPTFILDGNPFYMEPIYVDDQPVHYWVANSSYTTVFNLTGSPVVVIPVGFNKEGLPISIQIVGRRWQDMELLYIAELINTVSNAFKNPPGF